MLELVGVCKAFAGRPVLSGLDLTLPTGEPTLLTGASGSGKTTLLRLIAGLEVPDQGEIRLRGERVAWPGGGLAPHLRGVGLVFQDCALWPHLTVADNVAFGLHGHPGREERLEKVLREVGAEHLRERRPAGLSGGEARRVALARTLAPEPDWLLLDEPLAHLDETLSRELLACIFGQVERTGAGLLVVSHQTLPEGAFRHRLHLQQGRLEAV